MTAALDHYHARMQRCWIISTGIWMAIWTWTR
jgi:hypothetical protein